MPAMVMSGALLTGMVALHAAAAGLPWAPPAPDSPDLIAYLRNTSLPKLAYSTYVGWYEDGGMNETTLMQQVLCARRAHHAFFKAAASTRRGCASVPAATHPLFFQCSVSTPNAKTAAVPVTVSA